MQYIHTIIYAEHSNFLPVNVVYPCLIKVLHRCSFPRRTRNSITEPPIFTITARGNVVSNKCQFGRTYVTLHAAITYKREIQYKEFPMTLVIN